MDRVVNGIKSLKLKQLLAFCFVALLLVVTTACSGDVDETSSKTSGEIPIYEGLITFYQGEVVEETAVEEVVVEEVASEAPVEEIIEETPAEEVVSEVPVEEIN